MSTRSGKRIHSSFHENILKSDVELGYRSEKKTRNRRLKENFEDNNVTLLKSKKRENYVSFPTDDESVGDSAVNKEPEHNMTRLLRKKNALKEQNTTVVDLATLDSTKEPKKLARQTRRTKKFSENVTEDISDTKTNEVAILEVVEKPKPKKNKKKKEPLEQTTEEAATIQTRKSKRKKKKSSQNSQIVDENKQNPVKDNSINQSNMSIDSFHSAAGSPQKLNLNEANKEDLSNKTLESKLNSERKSINASLNEKTNKSEKQKKSKPANNTPLETDTASIDLEDTAQYDTIKKINKSDAKDSTIDKNNISDDTIPQKRQSKRKCSIRDNNISLSSNKDVNTTFEKDTDIIIDNKCSQNGQFRKRKSSIKDSTLTFTQTDEIVISQDTNLIIRPTITEDIKTAFDQATKAGSSSTRKRKYSVKDNTTFEKDNVVESTGTRKRKSSMKDNNISITPTSINTTFEKDELKSTGTRKRKSSIKDNNLSLTQTSTEIINTTFEKDTKYESDIRNRKSSVKDTNLTFTPTSVNTTFENNTEVTKCTSTGNRKSLVKDTNLTFTPTSVNTTFENNTEVTKCTSTGNRKSLVKDTNLTFTPTSVNTTFENNTEVTKCTSTGNRKSLVKDTNLTFTPTIINTTFEKDTERPKSTSNGNRKSLVKDSNLTFTPTIINNTFEKDTEIENTNNRKRKSSIKDTNLTFSSTSINTTFEKDTERPKSTSNGNRKSLVKDNNTPTITKEINTTFDKSDNSVICINTTFEKSNSNEVNNRKSIINSETFNSTYDKSPALNETNEKSVQNNTFNQSKEVTETSCDIDKKLDSTYDKSNSKSSLVTSDSSNNTIGNDLSHVSITSDESSEKIMNTTPLLIESSMEDSSLLDDTKKAESPVKQPQTPLKREGTFTKESPLVESLLNKTPTKRMSLPSPGCTPYLSRSSNREKMVLNVTRSIEKGRRSSLLDIAPRQTKVMFCSPVNDPVVVKQQKRKVIKSNLKGSNKSFVFEESVSRPAPRKRSYTLSDADDARAKRKRLADDMQHSVDRLSRPRTSSASAKLEPSTPSKKHTTPSKSKPEAKVSRTKLPNFAALHRRQFDKMESLDECQERKAKRAKQLLTPTGTLNMDRSAKGPSPEQSQKDPKSQGTPAKRFHTQLPSIDSIKPGYTRFGFKLNMDANPFSIPSKNEQAKPKENKPNGLTREPTLPSLVGGTSLRREAAKQIVLREKSFTGKRNTKRNENRTVIKGVRTNRRFELQMRMRNIE